MARYEARNGKIFFDRLGSTTFLGENVYVPYFWAKYQDGWNDDTHTSGDPLFLILPEDIEQFPELISTYQSQRILLLRLHEFPDGSVGEYGLDEVPPPSRSNPESYTRQVEDGGQDGFQGVPPRYLTPEYLRAYADGVERRRDG